MIQTLRHRMIFIPLLVVLVASVSGGGVAAQALTGSDESSKTRLFERTAEILNIDPTALQEAFEQAGTKLSDQKIDSLLADLVANGHLTEEEQAKIEEWLNTIPESIGTISAATLRGLLDGDGPTFVKQLVEAHGGMVSVESPAHADGSGTRFTVRLPA
jgi:Na+-transporting NADH:ubiquinone oxidoreductase subunit NqrC